MDENKKSNIPLADEQIESIEKRLRAEQKVPASESNPTPRPTQRPPEERSESVLKTLRTYQGDVAEIIQKKNASLLDVAMAEKKKKDEGKKQEPVSPETKKNFMLISLSVLFVLVGVGAIIGFFLIQKRQPVQVQNPETRSETLLSFNEKKIFDVTQANRESLLGIIRSEIEKWSGSPDDILFISLAKDSMGISPEELLSILEARAPSSLQRALDTKQMVGVYRGKSKNLFLLFSVASFENAFDGMLKWESSIYDDLWSLFSYPLSSNTSGLQDKSSTSTQSTSSQAIYDSSRVATSFEDLTIKNKDARILRSERGDIVILYSFLNKKTILITGSEEVFREIIDRFLSSSFIR